MCVLLVKSSICKFQMLELVNGCQIWISSKSLGKCQNWPKNGLKSKKLENKKVGILCGLLYKGTL